MDYFTGMVLVVLIFIRSLWTAFENFINLSIILIQNVTRKPEKLNNQTFVHMNISTNNRILMWKNYVFLYFIHIIINIIVHIYNTPMKYIEKFKVYIFYHNICTDFTYMLLTTHGHMYMFE